MNPFSALMVLCEESTSGSPDKGPVMRSFDAFFKVRMNKQLNE